ncbi:hypothetical protein EON67_00750 [archaeon]|nr:MAG: hypothetical protein EON67_00750 [archaeon]
MENAKLGDAMIEKLRAAGTAAEKEKQAAMGMWRARERAHARTHAAWPRAWPHAPVRTRALIARCRAPATTSIGTEG